MSLLTPIHFRDPSLIFGPLVTKYLAKNGVSGTFWKKYWLNSFHTWHLSLWGESLDPYTFSCSSTHFRPFGGQIFGRKWGFRNFLKKIMAQFISYLAFILMGWVSWPLYIFVFLASFRPSDGQIFHWKWGFRNLKKKKKLVIFIGYFWMRWVVIRAGYIVPIYGHSLFQSSVIL